MGGVQTSSGNTTQENAIVQKMNSILGTSHYSMSGDDCSSTVIKNSIVANPGGSTPEILDSPNGIVVDKYSSGDPLQQTSSGPNLDKLKPGDLLLYSIPTSGFSSGRKNRFSHVKMYMGQGKRVGH